MPTLVAAAGEPDVTQKLLDGYDAAGKTFKVHLDGFDQHDCLAGGPTKRHAFFYWTDDGDLAGLRYDQWKVVFLEQQHEGFTSGSSRLIAAARAPSRQSSHRSVRESDARSPANTRSGTSSACS